MIPVHTPSLEFHLKTYLNVWNEVVRMMTMRLYRLECLERELGSMSRRLIGYEVVSVY